jgi:D-serine deaminase-like pyridoxal phosphate-dependent protein
VSARTGSNRYLVLHLPFLPAILNAFPNAQVQIGKAQTTNAMNQFFQSIPVADRVDATSRVTFLVDSRWRLSEYAALAASLSLTLQVGVEIDVGIHRSGVRHVSDLPDVLAGFVGNPVLRFGGMLGYDGHVPSAPGPPGLEETAARAAFRNVTATYQSFVDVLRSQFTMLVRNDLVFNSGGTATYPLWTTGPVNDVAAGGGILRPGTYPSMFIPDLLPAIFIAAPVLNHYDTVEIPFVTATSGSLLHGNQGLELCGGGWAADYVYPSGVQDVPIEAGPGNENLVPNQGLVMAPSMPVFGPGDWVFTYPHESDVIFDFEKILLIRGGRLQPTQWNAYPRRY